MLVLLMSAITYFMYEALRNAPILPMKTLCQAALTMLKILRTAMKLMPQLRAKQLLLIS